jgi:hypothetical protein
MGTVFVYVVARDFGFAPNPFHGYCTLATCKALIRKRATVGDWVIGMGGSRLKATGRCVFGMRVTEKLTFNDYWMAPKFLDKRPVRNGSQTMMVGDNIYHFDTATNAWQQADSHHSNPDGSVNQFNLARDTKWANVLISEQFFYFGSRAVTVPSAILEPLGYKNRIMHWEFKDTDTAELIDWMQSSFPTYLNRVVADPFDFDESEKRYSAGTNKIT